MGLPSSPLDYRARALDKAEDVLASLPPGGGTFTRLRAYLLASSETPREALHAWFVEGYADEVAPEWKRRLHRAGLTNKDRVRLVFDVVEDAEAVSGEKEQKSLRKQGVVVVPERGPATTARLALEVGDPSVLEGPPGPVVVEAGRSAYVGRQRTVTDTGGHVVRTNDLAFRDSLRSISRLQARVAYDDERERFELHDGEGAVRTQVLRRGQPVENMRPLPTPLEDGDVIRLPGGVEVRCRVLPG